MEKNKEIIQESISWGDIDVPDPNQLIELKNKLIERVQEKYTVHQVIKEINAVTKSETILVLLVSEKNKED